ncbi:MAG: hypothetical protein ACTSU6_02795 [Candidatus Njordarchaeales archaeon]
MNSIMTFIESNGDKSKTAIFLVDSKEFEELTTKFSEIYKQKDTVEFLQTITKYLYELKKRSKKFDIEGITVSETEFGKIIGVNFEALPEDLLLVSFAERYWANPKDKNEVYLSIEVKIYLKGDVKKTYQRVIVTKGNLVRDLLMTS